MFKKTLSAVMLFLLVISTLTLAFQTQSVKADDGTVYINADGSISPSTAPIYTADNITYTLTGNITAQDDGIVIERGKIVLNGAGYAVTGRRILNGGNGTTLMNISNVTVTNMTITNFDFGIELCYSSDNTFSSCNVTNNWSSILLESSSGNTFSGNNVTNNSGSLDLESSSDNTLSGNNVANDFAGIYLGSSSDSNILSDNYVTADTMFGMVIVGSSNNTLSGNVMRRSLWNFGVLGNSLTDFLQSIDTSNLVDGEPVYYFVNQSDLVVDADAYPQVGYLGLVNCTSVTVQGINLTDSSQGLLLAFTNDSKITGNNAANNGEGVELDYSFGNALSGNNFTNNLVGIELYSSHDNALSGNNVTTNNMLGHGIGIEIDSSSGNSIFHNNFVDNAEQVASENSRNTWDDGYPSGGDYWSNYNGTDTYSGPYQNLTGSDGISDTPYIIDANDIDHYPLMNPYNAGSLSVTISPSSATLDVGQTQTFNSTVSGGTLQYSYQWYLNSSAVQGANFSSWAFTPTSAGPYTVYMEVNDSVGAQATSNAATVTVNMAVHDVAVTNVTVPVRQAYKGWVINVNVTVANLGNATETFSVTLSYNNTSIATLPVTDLAPNSTQTLVFSWNMTNVPPGNYTIRAYAQPVPGETNAANNVLVDGTLRINLMGDINGDGKVDILDMIQFAKYFGLPQGDPRWNPDADMNRDGVTNILDAIIIAEHFGASSP